MAWRNRGWRDEWVNGTSKVNAFRRILLSKLTLPGDVRVLIRLTVKSTLQGYACGSNFAEAVAS